jgi:very-short-patch-repair endonuclease
MHDRRMHRVAAALSTMGGVAARPDLVARGFTGRQLSHAVNTGAVLRPRQGWYALASTPDPVMRAVRVGGRLCCASAAALRGLWVLDDSLLHVAVPPNAARLRTADDNAMRLNPATELSDVVLHWRSAWDGRPAARVVVPFLESLEQVLACQPEEHALCVLDSSLFLRRTTHEELVGLLHRLPRRCAGVVAQSSALAESGIETLARVRLQRLGIIPRLQVPIRGIGRVDMVIGTGLIIELDGREHHAGPEAFEADRRRDAALHALGYRVLRFSYRQVVSDWDAVETTILRLIARGAHLERPLG